MPFKEQGIDKINSIINSNQSKTELAQYLHGCAFSPGISTFQEFIRKRNFITWPGIEQLSFKKINKDYRSHIKRSLRPRKEEPAISKSIDTTTNNHRIVKTRCFSTTETCKDKKFFYMISNMTTAFKSYIDLTGRFPHQSSRGNKYVFVAYKYNKNAILVEPMKNREADTIINVWK